MAGTLGLKKGTHVDTPTAPDSVATPDPYVGINTAADPYAGLGHVSEKEEDRNADDEEIAIDTSMTSTAADPPAVIRHESIIAALEAHALAAQRSGHLGTHVLIHQIVVAAGALKQATAAAHGKVGGEVGGVIETLHELL